MNKKNHKDIILEILTKNDRVQRSDLKEMVRIKMGIERYAKQSFSYHINSLVNDRKIQRIDTDSNNEYIALPKSYHSIHGELVILNLNGRIHVPELLAGYDISILDTTPSILNKENIHFIFQFNAKTFCLKIPKIAIPFKLHISRKKYHETIHQQVKKEFGARTITLELPILNISSYSIDNQEKAKKGQILMSFEDNHYTITEFKTTNQSQFAIIENLNYQNFQDEISLLSDLTIDSKFEKRSSIINGKKNISNEAEDRLQLPVLILLSPDSQVGIF